MKLKSLLFFILLLPAIAYCQSITMPAVGYSEDHTTKITKVEVTKANTVVTFKHVMQGKGAWVQLNKSMYLQDAKGEEKYNYIKSEGIPVRPKRLTSDKDYQEIEFKVYFEKLKPGTQEINVIERARSMPEQANGTKFFNYYNVSLSKQSSVEEHVKVTDVVLMPPPQMDNTPVRIDTTTSVSMDAGAMMASFAPMMGNMYSSILNAQLKIYSNPETTTQLARITKNYYDALIKVGFSEDAALRIITSKQLVSVDMGKQ
jgi:hypothetical protein